MESMTPPPPDDELPPPPADIADRGKDFPPLKTRKPTPLANLKRSAAIFEKDLRTVAKHGLVGAIILLIVLGAIFYVLSFAMQQMVMMNLSGGDNENGPGPLPGTTDKTAPVALMNLGSSPILADTLVTLDASASYDADSSIIYYIWNFKDQDRSVELYGRTVTHTFMATGDYNITLTVVDAAWNMAQSNGTLTVNHRGTDSEPPVAWGGGQQDVNLGALVTLNGSGSIDNVGVMNWTWSFLEYDWRVERVLYGERPTYRFDISGMYDIQLVVRDAAGNWARGGTYVRVFTSGDGIGPKLDIGAPRMVNVGDTVMLTSRIVHQNASIQGFVWYISQNGTTVERVGETATFTATDQGVYRVVLTAKDALGNPGSAEVEVVVVPAFIDPDSPSWDATPLGFGVPFNLLTYAYAIGLLSSVVFIGGFFAKGFTHEITKGTIKILFFGPISVTNMILAKILYPLVMGPAFILPLVLVSLLPLHHPAGEVLTIALVSYAFCAVTMVAAAYGACLIYAVTKRMSIKPSVMSRLFLYLSLIFTFTIGAWSAFLMGQWFEATAYWNGFWSDASWMTMFSPFHQGGLLLSQIFLDSPQAPDWILLIIPAALIAGGALASRFLYSDIFSRE